MFAASPWSRYSSAEGCVLDDEGFGNRFPAEENSFFFFTAYVLDLGPIQQMGIKALCRTINQPCRAEKETASLHLRLNHNLYEA
jgi:hypothetical protein